VAGTLTVARLITVAAGVVSVGDTKTHQVRRLALDPVAFDVLGRHRLEPEAMAAAFQVDLEADAYILSREPRGHRACLPDGLTLAFAAACIGAGLTRPGSAGRPGPPLWHFHDLRHFAATTAIRRGQRGVPA